MDPVHGELDTAVDIRDVQRSYPATLRELPHLLHSEGPDVALQVLLLHLHLLRQLEQQTGRAAQMEYCLREDWPEGRLLIFLIIKGVKSLTLVVVAEPGDLPPEGHRGDTELPRLIN